VNSRVSQFRHDLKQMALPIIVEHYNLKEPGLVGRVEKLSQRRTYIFPGGVDKVHPTHSLPSMANSNCPGNYQTRQAVSTFCFSCSYGQIVFQETDGLGASIHGLILLFN
jgi:hypothetical protein